MNSITVSNIDNLTSLWKAACLPFGQYHEKEGISHCHIEGSAWPNRVWLRGDVSSEGLDIIVHLIKNSETALTFSYFDRDNGSKVPLIENKGFVEKSVQHGMNLVLKHPYEEPGRLDFQRVKGGEDSRYWCSAFEASFRYGISEDTLEKSPESMAFFNILHEGKVIGTVLLYLTGQTAGIHSLGIIPAMRGMGFAREAMHFILNRALAAGASHATLQASNMARKMYEDLDFSEHFLLRNYQLNL